MKSPFLPSSGAPRRCLTCDGPILVRGDEIIDDSPAHRWKPHAKVCSGPRVEAPRPKPEKLPPRRTRVPRTLEKEGIAATIRARSR